MTSWHKHDWVDTNDEMLDFAADDFFPPICNFSCGKAVLFLWVLFFLLLLLLNLFKPSCLDISSQKNWKKSAGTSLKCCGGKISNKLDTVPQDSGGILLWRQTDLLLNNSSCWTLCVEEQPLNSQRWDPEKSSAPISFLCFIVFSLSTWYHQMKIRSLWTLTETLLNVFLNVFLLFDELTQKMSQSVVTRLEAPLLWVSLFYLYLDSDLYFLSKCYFYYLCLW